MLGFDIDPAHTGRISTQWRQFRGASSDAEEIQRQEEEILSIFVDICALFRRKPGNSDASGGEAPSSEAYLFTYLRMINTQGEGLPRTFLEALRRVLAHYGIATLDPSPALEETLLWIYKSHQRMERQNAAILSVLERRLASGEVLSPEKHDVFRTILDRLISITRGSAPSISDLAREVRYHGFDQPVFESSRKLVYAQLEQQLDYLTAYPDAADRDQRMRAVIDCPQPLATILSRRLAAAPPAAQQLMLQMIASRYYCVRTLTNFHALPANGNCCVSAEYEENGKRVHIFTTHADYNGLLKAMQAVKPAIEQVPPGDDIVLDFFTWKDGALSDPETAQREIYSTVNVADLPARLKHVVVAVSGPGQDPGMAGMQHFTYEPFETGYRGSRAAARNSSHDGRAPSLVALAEFQDRSPALRRRRLPAARCCQ